MLDDSYFMKQALNEAKQAFDKDEVPIGAVVVCNNRIIARAHNLTETLNDVTAHAEMQAITAAANVLGGKYLNECTLYVTMSLVLCVQAHWAGHNYSVLYMERVTIKEATHIFQQKYCTLKHKLVLVY